MRGKVATYPYSTEKGREEMPVKKSEFYSWYVNDAVEKALPQVVKDAMNISGWNAFGIYELVKSELKKDAKK